MCRSVIETLINGVPTSLIPPDSFTFNYGDRGIYFRDSESFLFEFAVDVGGGVGDTAILFALKGAREIISLEPQPTLYKQALENLRINNIEGKVKLLNAALSESNGYIDTCISDINDYVEFKPSLNACNNVIRVRTYSLESLINEFNISDAALKVNCEGYEYHTVAKAGLDVLRHFNEIMVKYHNDYEPVLEDLRKAEFKTKIIPK